MGAYFQMGHDTENLVGENDLNEFTGIILSPVNREPNWFVQDIKSFRKIEQFSRNGRFDIVLDSQLYVPRSNRGSLPTHDYFPSDLETADLSSLEWWSAVSNNLAKYLENLDVDAVTSPVCIPNVWQDDYYSLCTETYRNLKDILEGKKTRALMTLLVNFNQMGTPDAALNLASVASSANPDGYYLVISSDIEPRRELTGEYQLAGIMELIKLLEDTGKPVLVSHCSSEMILFKAANASHCATGKFFNLRRFTKNRYQEPSSGGGQLPYWFEQSLFAFLRGADIIRLQKKGLDSLLGQNSSGNYWSQEILNQFATDPTAPWVRLGWRQFLSWFGKAEQILSTDNAFQTVEDWLIQAESNWQEISKNKVLFDEPTNDGSWIRNWRQVLNEYSDRLSRY